MKIFLKLTTAILTMMFLGSCQKDINYFVADSVAVPDTAWQNTINASMSVISLKNDLRLTEQTDHFTYTNADLTYANGISTLFLPANSISTGIGGTVTGNITERSLLILKKGDIIRMDMPTVSGGRLMVSGGSFFLDLKRENEVINVAVDKKISFKYLTNLTAQGMQVYNATGDVVSGYTWTANNDLTYNHVVLPGNGLEVFMNRMQWVQAAYLFDTIGIPQTKISVKLPSNYTNANTSVYVVFNDMQCVAGTSANMSDRTFQSGDLPVNRSVTLVVLSKQSGDYYMGSQQLFTSTAPAQTISITPVKRSFENVTAFLNSL